MKLAGFRVQMYKCIIDSGWIDINPLTVLVGKNESGKTSLLRALHKLNPFTPDPYSIDREWPRGRRQARNTDQMVCTAKFELTQAEVEHLSTLTDQKLTSSMIRVSRDYQGRLEVDFPDEVFPNRLHPNDIDEICMALPEPMAPVSESMEKQVRTCTKEVLRLTHEGRYVDLADLKNEHLQLLNSASTSEDGTQEKLNEEELISEYQSRFEQIEQRLRETPSMQQRAHEYVVQCLPTFIYMSDYRAFTGTAQLDQVRDRMKRAQLTDEDKTLLTIMELSGLNLDEEVEKGNSSDREQRQYDLDDAAASLTRTISERWRQGRYQVQFRADGQLFYTFVKDERDPSLIRLEERSKGFQWFFSFDLMFMHETNGTFENCVLLLDEPGLHLHPDAQKDLLRRMENYAANNVLIYTTHLPFMIDLRQPDRIRTLTETNDGTLVSADLMKSQPEEKLVLQAALGMSGSNSYLVSERNLVVEGVDDYWIVSELSNLMSRSGHEPLLEDILVTPAGGASEAAYIATFMIGQGLDVAVLLDSDQAGGEARDALVKKWLTHYQSSTAQVLSLGETIGVSKEFSIEDIFPDDFYLGFVNQVYEKQLKAFAVKKLKLQGNDQLSKRVERALAEHKIPFNKGSVAKKLRRALSEMKSISDLPEETQERAKLLITSINAVFSKAESAQ